MILVRWECIRLGRWLIIWDLSHLAEQCLEGAHCARNLLNIIAHLRDVATSEREQSLRIENSHIHILLLGQDADLGISLLGVGLPRLVALVRHVRDAKLGPQLWQNLHGIAARHVQPRPAFAQALVEIGQALDEEVGPKSVAVQELVAVPIEDVHWIHLAALAQLERLEQSRIVA